MMVDILQQIIAVKREEVSLARRKISMATLSQVAGCAPAARGFVSALRAKLGQGRPAVIAEMKRASPSQGVLRERFDPAEIACSYERNGAACISVLTDVKHFLGASQDLVAARDACALPVLQKDFMIDPYQIYQARAFGADCILLIVAALARDQMQTLESCACELGMDVLVESHNGDELESALELKTELIGINNRDLRSFETNLDTTLSLMARVPPSRMIVTESGIKSPRDVARMRDEGIRAFLVGEALMRSDDPGEGLRQLFFDSAVPKSRSANHP